MATPKIYLKKVNDDNEGQLYLYYSHGRGKRFEYFTGLRVNRKYYNDLHLKNQNLKPIKKNFVFSEQYNQLIDEMCSFVVSLVVNEGVSENSDLRKLIGEKFNNERVSRDREDFVSYCERVLEERVSGRRLIIKGTRQGQLYSEYSHRTLEAVIGSLKKYYKYKGRKLYFEIINNDFYNDYRDFIVNKSKLKVSTFANRVKEIKSIMNIALEEKLHDNIEFKSSRFVTPKYDSEQVYLTLDEIKSIHEAEVEEQYEDVKDLFLIACYSGLRYGDFSRLKPENIEKGFIRLTQSKTSGKVSIPVMKGLKDILDKRNGAIPPASSLVVFNRKIKKICAMDSIGIDRKVGVDNEGKPIMFSSMISSHTGRRSYATNMFKLGVPTTLIMTATGHKKEEMFLRYIRATNEEKSLMLAEWMEKLNI